VSESKLVLIGGGARSGKSAYAVQRALALGPRRVFIATAEAFDDEMRARIAAHVTERANHFTTIDAPYELERAFESTQTRPEVVDVVLIDCLTLWLSNLLLASVPSAEIEQRVSRLAKACETATCPVLLVTNEVGFGLVPDTALGRQFRDISVPSASTVGPFGRRGAAGSAGMHAPHQAGTGDSRGSALGMIAAVALLIAVVLDRAFGEPPNALHPVAWMGSAIARGRDWAMRASRLGQFVRGALVALTLPVVCAAVAFVASRAVSRWVLLSALATALLLKPLFAIRALRDAAFLVRDALTADDVVLARSQLASLCSRNASELGPAALIAATVESIAENASDSIVAPLFYFTLAGLPGAAFYRAGNTLDAMIGYHGRYEWVGKTAARLDDLLNLLPARLTSLLFLLVAPLSGGNVRRGVAILWRDGARTESPNAGRPMAAMAGLLGIRLEKQGHYALGDATRPIEPGDITRAWRIVVAAAYASVVLASLGLIALTELS
jgi:adenosylcobinamide-phosphate synthase